VVSGLHCVTADSNKSALFPADIPIIPTQQEHENISQSEDLNPSSRSVQELSSSSNQSYVPGEVFVRYAPQKQSNETIEQQMMIESTIVGASTLLDYTPEGISGLYLVSIPSEIPVEEAVAQYEEQPGVLYAEPNYYIHAASIPDDPYFNLQWGLYNTGQIIEGQAGVLGSDIQAPEAWDISTGARDHAIIALVDSGVDLDHPDLVDNLWTDPLTGTHGYNVLDGDYEPWDLTEAGHGTHCAGIMGAVGNNGIGVAGVNWQAQVMVVRFLNAGGQGDIKGAISAISWADEHGADIISCSFDTLDYSQSLYDVISSSPALFVCAAGNQNQNIDVTPHYPASFNCPNIISVGSSNNLDALSAGSNYGIISVDLVAPGDNIYSTIPMEYVDTEDIGDPHAESSGYGYLSGTSMAVPFVSGSAAILMDICPSCTNEQISNAILETTDPIPALTGYIRTGGRLNLAKAVQSLSPVDPTTGDIPLEAGWNCVSIPKVLLSGYNTGSIFSGVSTSGHSILIFEDGTWRAMKSDEVILPFQGIWIFSDTADSVHLLFDPNPLSSPERLIQQGWESVGYYGILEKDPCDAFASLNNSWRFIVGFDAAHQKYSDILHNTCSISDSSEDVFPYHGYWLFSESSGILKANE